jgi:hypothetical protein
VKFVNVQCIMLTNYKTFEVVDHISKLCRISHHLLVLKYFNYFPVNCLIKRTDVNYRQRTHRSGTALQIGRSLVRFQVVSLEFFIEIILPIELWPLGSTQPVTEMSTRSIFWGVKVAGA